MRSSFHITCMLFVAVALTGASVSAFSVPKPPAAADASIAGNDSPSSSSAAPPDIVRSFALFENIDVDEEDEMKSNVDNNKRCIGRCEEIRQSSRDPNADEDEVELLYQTTHRSFTFPHGWTDEVESHYQTTQRSFLFPEADGWDESTEAGRLLPADSIRQHRVTIRQTSFGCGRLGATVWPSGIALASLLSGDSRSLIEGKRVLELGSGCGLPSLVAKEIGRASDILATDYWEEEDGNFDSDRLVPKNLFGANLAYNLQSDAAVRRLDWHDEMNVIYAADQFCPDVIIGSDLVYYPMDTAPLIKTLNIFLKSASDALLVLPLPPRAEREALPDFRSRLENGEIEDCEVHMDEMLMVGRGNEDCHNLLRIHIRKKQQ